MMELTRMNDVFPTWATGGGIFSALQNFPVPWKDENISSALDVEYHGNVSGDKFISPLVKKIKSGDVLTDDEKTMIATSIMAVCGVNWAKQWETLSFDYVPIENYRMVERMTDDKTVTEYGKTTTRDDNLSHGRTGTETRTDTATDETTPNLTTSTANKVHGFNSTTGVSSDEQNETQTGKQTTNRNETNELEINTTDTDTGTQTLTDGGTDTNTRNYELTRSGNIGVTTSQQMIQSERDLWMWHYFYNVVFPDIDRILTLPIY